VGVRGAGGNHDAKEGRHHDGPGTNEYQYKGANQFGETGAILIVGHHSPPRITVSRQIMAGANGVSSHRLIANGTQAWYSKNGPALCVMAP